MYEAITQGLADQLYGALRRRYHFVRPTARLGSRPEAMMTLYFNAAGEQTQQVDDHWITMVLAQPLSDRGDGCVEIRLSRTNMIRGQRREQQHSRRFELSNPAIFEQMIQWSRSMLGRYCRDLTDIIRTQT